MAAIIDQLNSALNFIRTDRNSLLLVLGCAGAVVVGSLAYGTVCRRRQAEKQKKIYPFKVIKPPTASVGLESKRTVAIVGATGYVGSNVTEHLIENGEHRVYMLGRRFNDENTNPQADAIYQVDMMSIESLEKAFNGVDSVIYSAVVIPTVYSTAEDIRNMNIMGAQNVLNAARNAGVTNIILISGIKFVQEHKNTEARALVSAFEYIESLFLRANEHNGINTCVLAFSQIYGSNNHLYKAVLKGEVKYFPLLESHASFVPVEMVAEAVIKAEGKLNQGDELVTGKVLSITGQPSTIREFLTHSSLGVKVKNVPVFVVRLAARVNQLVASVTGFAPFGISLSPAMASFFNVDEEHYDSKIPQEALGIGPAPPLDQGIPKMVAKFRSHNDC